MRSIEEELKIKKVEIDNIETPGELEDRLRSALSSVEEGDRMIEAKGLWFIRHRALAAVLLLVAFLCIYNYDVFAYYGKKVLGYDEVAYGSIKELNEMGMGQEIKKSYKFKNGTELSVDGVMLDENKLVVMYTIKGENKEKIEKLNLAPLKGILGRYHPISGRGKLSEDRKEIRWVQEFETPMVFDKTVTFSMTSYGNDISRSETGSITFRIDMNKAIKHVVKSEINQMLEFVGTKYKFTTMSATPMSVVIEGSIETASEEENKLYSGADFRSPRRNLHIELVETYLKDGELVTEKLQGQGMGIGSGAGRIEFQYEFDGLKSDVKELSLNIVKIEDMRIVDKAINVSEETKNVRVVPETDELIVKNVKIQGSNTVVNFSVQNDVAFVAALMTEGEQAKVLDESSKIVEGGGTHRIEKILTFEGSGKDMKLMFKTISHESYINKQITIYQGK